MEEVPEPDPLERPVSVLAPAMEFGAAYCMLLLQRNYSMTFYPAPLLPCIVIGWMRPPETRMSHGWDIL